jgi:hypothetical protein
VLLQDVQQEVCSEVCRASRVVGTGRSTPIYDESAGATLRIPGITYFVSALPLGEIDRSTNFKGLHWGAGRPTSRMREASGVARRDGWGRNAGGEILFSSTPDIPKLEKGVDGISEQRECPNLPDEHGLGTQSKANTRDGRK